jgi:hypothetical protein
MISRRFAALTVVTLTSALLGACGGSGTSASTTISSSTTPSSTTSTGLHPGAVLPGITISNPSNVSGTAQELSSKMTVVFENYSGPRYATSTTTCNPNSGPSAGTYTCVVKSPDGTALDAVILGVTASGEVTFVSDVLQDIESASSSSSSETSSVATTTSTAEANSTQTGTTSSGTGTSSTAPSSSASTRCGTVTGGNDDFQGQTLTVYAGAGVSCATATTVMSDLSAGKATNHQGASDASSYFIVDGWTCPYGNMGAQVCSKGSQQVQAYAPGSGP